MTLTARTILGVRVAAAVALAALLLSGCSKVIDESQIPVVTVPGHRHDAADERRSGHDRGRRARSEAPITLGSVSLDPCKDVTGAWCGSMDVPLDRSHPDGDQISVGVELHPRTDVSTKSRARSSRSKAAPASRRPARATPTSTLFDADHGPPRPPARRRPRHGSVVTAELQRRCSRATTRSPPRATARSRWATAADDYGAATVADDLADVLGALERRAHRPVRRQLRHVRRAGVRGPPRRPADERSCSTARSPSPEVTRSTRHGCPRCSRRSTPCARER